MNIVVLSPHMDDETLCLGGTISKWVANGDSVLVVNVFNDSTVCNGRMVSAEERRAEFQSVLAVLGCSGVCLESTRGHEDSGVCPVGPVIGEVETILNRFNANVVLFPSVTEHQDHAFVSKLGDVLMRASGNSRREYLEYPMPYRGLDNVLNGLYVDVTDYVDNKLKALSMYESQVRNNGVISDKVILFGKMYGEIFGTGRVYEKLIPRRKFV